MIPPVVYLSLSIEKISNQGDIYMICKSIVLLSFCLSLSSCANFKNNSNSNHANNSFIGDWQGEGTDSKGNSFNFYARVIHSGDNRYRLLILTDLEKINEPIHIMDGVLENNKYSYNLIYLSACVPWFPKSIGGRYRYWT